MLLCVVAALLSSGGCQGIAKALENAFKTGPKRWFSPQEVVSTPDRPLVNPILTSVGMGDQYQELVPNATFPREGDWEYTEEDYTIGPTDILDISVLDLYTQGREEILRREVSDSGYIDMPLLTDRIKAKGLTQEQLKGAIREAYRKADLLLDAGVAVMVVARRQSVYSIFGAISRPGTYNVTRRDMRLLEALAAPGGITQSNIPYIYVIRPTAAPVAKPQEPKKPAEVQLPPLPPEADTFRELQKFLPGTAPATQPATRPQSSEAPQLTEMATAGAGPVADDLGQALQPSRWMYSDGRWVRVEPTTTAPATREALAPRKAEGPADPYGWRKIERSDLARIVAINLSKLHAGDPRMNIIVRDNDIIHVPVLEEGEFYVGGRVLRPGVYRLTGRQVTVKQAVIAAGNIDELGWPENAILVRRIGDLQEQVIPLNIEAIFKGEEPDKFLRPNDIIAVGTDVKAVGMAVVRNAFRMTYGFGFIWDRNFAEPLITGGEYNSRRFTRW